MKIEFTAEMIQEEKNRDVLLEPGWYKAKIKGVDVKPSASSDGTNYNMSFTIATTINGTPMTKTVYRIFSTNGLGFWPDVIAAAQGMTKQALLDNWDAHKKIGGSIDLDEEIRGLDGSDLMLQIGLREYNGKPQMDVQGFAPAGSLKF